MGKKGGKKSVESRFAGKTKEEISEIMKGVRKASKKDQKVWDKMSNEALGSLKSIHKDP